MSLARIERTSLWCKSLGEQEKDLYKLDRDALRVDFLKFRKKAEQLVSKISSSLPDLTIHDVSHLDALWEVASLIAGEDYPLNALEGFVFGGAILLHDSALCFEAYSGGLGEIRNTITWKDSYAAALDKSDKLSEDEIKKEADFSTLRQLHAEQSSKLIEKEWKDPDTGESIFLIDDPTLRKHLGQIIGQISASHHWDIEKVSNVFSSQVNAPATFPREWRIDPLKIACLLRCADAAHIDNERAPDFLHALVRREGISLSHWQAQNKLGNVDIDQSDNKSTSLLFTSTRDFTEQDASSWWVAYDAACLVDREIRSCNSTLEKTNISPVFKAKRVKAVESPDLMKEYIKVSGWTPCSASIHVSNVENLVKNLGGQQLYGINDNEDLLQIAIRELIQNARDSIQARSAIDFSFRGKITLNLFQEDGKTWLIVEDNGVGMSERVLTGPLLDFGTSFWTSSLVQNEFPGLRSSEFKSVGKFGIGFYSVFMASDEVYVSSRPWKNGLNDVKRLEFAKGVSFRPLLKTGINGSFDIYSSTQVKLLIKENFIDSDLKVNIKRNLMGAVGLRVDFVNLISAICAGLDVSVYVDVNGKKEKAHHAITDDNFDVESWLKEISFAKYQEHDVEKYIIEHAQRIKPIKEGEKILGMAAISTIYEQQQDFLNIRTIGGLASAIHARDSSGFIGFIDCKLKSAKREQTNEYTASKDALKEWGNEQLVALSGLDLTLIEKYIVASNLSGFDIDTTSIASVIVNVNGQDLFFTIYEIVELARKIDIAIFKSRLGEIAETHHRVTSLNGFALIRAFRSGNFTSLKMNNKAPEDNFSLISLIHKEAIRRGLNPEWNIIDTDATEVFGDSMQAVILSVK